MGVAIPDWAICVIIATSASLLSNFGLNLQKLALNFRARKVAVAVFAMTWVLGFVFIVSGALCDFAGM